MENFKIWINENLIVLGRAVVLSLFTLSTLTVINPSVRSYVRQSFRKQFRTVLSTADTLTRVGKFKVVKIKTDQGIFIEIYDESKENIKPLIDRIQLPDKKDGFVMFRGQATNLAIDDIDGDEIPEILVPSYDTDLVAHLNVYSLNPKTNRFEKVQQ